MRMLNVNKKLLSIAIAGVLFSGVANSAYVDGIVSPGEYAAGTTLSLGFADEQNKTKNPIQGSFSFVTEGSYIYAALSAPTDFVDNLYGAPASVPDSGWVSGSSVATSGSGDSKKGKKDKKGKGTKGGSGHSFKQLVGSDKLFFDLNTINGTEYIEFDYLDDNHNSVIDSGSSFILDLATSLEYNLSHGCGDTTDSPDFTSPGLDAGCTSVLTYEWKMESSLFANFGAADFLNPTMHASPSKIGDHNFNPDCKDSAGTLANCPETTPPPVTSVSEPSAFVLFMAGLLGIGWLRRRKIV